MHPGDHETIDPDKCVELELLFKMGHCAGIRDGVKERVPPTNVDFATEAVRTCGPFTAAAAADAVKRGLKHLYVKQCRLMCFIRRLVAKMGSDFLLEVLMEGTELHVVVVGVESAGFVAQTKVVADLRKLKGSGVFCTARRTQLHAATRWEPCRHVQVEAMRSGTRFILAPTEGLKDTVEDGLINIWTDGKMTVEALVEQEPSLFWKVSPAKNSMFGGL